ncbi:MAG TPA: aminotransferase class I/II-fold pyridoxal phosphate-dependent enzyme [Candidatus Deferrimicrobium sp.]|nr:aminotransferase class I/II-fold pyridoxal phosphate-dependent enzyme [Candidatus Deferrimicrobium sp.]
MTTVPTILAAIEERLEDPSAKGLAQAVSRAVRDGALPPGTKLPPIRTLASRLGLSPTTVSAGWALLARSGAIRTDGRRGTTVADPQEPAPGRYRRALERQVDFALDLSTGTPDPKLLPNLGPALGELTTAGIPGSYLDDPVLPGLLEVLRAQWPYPPEELTVVDGAMDALDLAARSLLRFGDRVIVEHPGFPPLLDLLESIGVEVVGVPVDEAGLCPEPLGAALASRGSDTSAVFLQPRAQNPTGASMSGRRASELAAILARAGMPVIEDDSAGAVAATAPISLGQWIPDQVIHIRSFSKSHGPDLRLAAVGGPSHLLREIVHRRQLGQGWSSRMLQRVLLSLLTDPAAVAAVDRARDEYTRRRIALVEALTSRGVDVAAGDGLNLWVPVNDESAAIVRLASQGVGVTPGTPFDVRQGGGGHVRVTVGLVADGHEALAEILAAAANTSSWASRGR